MREADELARVAVHVGATVEHEDRLARAGKERSDRGPLHPGVQAQQQDRKSTRLNSSHQIISYAVFCLKKKKKKQATHTSQTDATTRKLLHDSQRSLPHETAHS